jgi:protease-4
VLASETVSKALEDAAKAPDIDAILFRIDSPGGSALASDLVWRATQIAKKKKPLIVSFSDVAASGGYYVACGADAIIAEPGSITGSIGVLMVRPVIGGFLDKLGIGSVALTRGEYADFFATTQPLSPRSRRRLAQEVRDVYDVFVSRVAEGRGLTLDEVDAVGRGRVWTGAQALELGLVDALGGFHTAIARARELAGLAAGVDVALVPYPTPKPLVVSIREALGNAAISESPLPLPRVVLQTVRWLAAFSEGGPVLVPPAIFEIH